MKIVRTALIVLCTIAAFQSVDSLRILGVFPYGSKLHYNSGHAIFMALAEKGHQVVFISPTRTEYPPENFDQVVLREPEKFLTPRQAGRKSFWTLPFESIDASNYITNATLYNNDFQRFMAIKKQHFDVIVVDIIMGDILLALGNYFNAPVIAMSSFAPTMWTSDLFRSPVLSLFSPNNMTLVDRVCNSLSFWYEELCLRWHYIPSQQRLLEKTFADAKKWPKFAEIRRNVPLVLVNTHVTMGTARPQLPNIIEVGGLHIGQSKKPLSAEVEEFLNDGENGVIYVSLGPHVSQLPPKKLEAISYGFSGFRHLRLLISSNEPVEFPSHAPSDVLSIEGLSHESVMAHPNVVLFVAYGDLFEVIEAVHFGKPIVGIPVYIDELLSMELAVKKGYGIAVPYADLTTARLRQAVERILSEDESYAENAVIVSKQFRDRITTPVETAVFWVEHVARHKGAPHLRSIAVDLPAYVLYNVDVWVAVVALLLLMCSTSWSIWHVISHARCFIPAKTKTKKPITSVKKKTKKGKSRKEE